METTPTKTESDETITEFKHVVKPWRGGFLLEYQGPVPQTIEEAWASSFNKVALVKFDKVNARHDISETGMRRQAMEKLLRYMREMIYWFDNATEFGEGSAVLPSGAGGGNSEITLGEMREMLSELENLEAERDEARRWARRWKLAAKHHRQHHLLAISAMNESLEVQRHEWELTEEARWWARRLYLELLELQEQEAM